MTTYVLPEKIEINPSTHPLECTIRVPGSKSITNRALLVAALAEGRTVLTNVLFSDDSEHFIESLRRLGFNIQAEPRKNSLLIDGLGGQIPVKHTECYVGNAGTAARFLTAFLTLGFGEYRIDGDKRMRQRPVGDLVNALNQLGAIIVPDSDRTEKSNQVIFPYDISLPLIIYANGLQGGNTAVSGQISSQFLSSLLMIAPYTRSAMEITVINDLNSKPYVDLTLAVMADFGVRVNRTGYEYFTILPQHYKSPGTYMIDSDASSATYFFAAPAICGGTVRVDNIIRRSQESRILHGDIAFLGILEQMGCTITEDESWIEVYGSGNPLRGVDVNLRDMPDTAQTLAAIAPFASSPTTIRGIASARFKETDRITAMCLELSRLGVTVTQYSDGLTIYPCNTIQPTMIHTYKDHRMAMAFALIGLKIPGISIEDPACVSKTFPNYFDVFARLQG